MSVILLVRHGQASLGAADYDQLSTVGETQSEMLGVALAGRKVTPTRLVAGQMRRHEQTASATRRAADWQLPVEFDDGWNEFDHVQVLRVHAAPETDEAVTERRAFQRWFELSTARWMSGDFDDEYDESFTAFTRRVESALRRTVSGLGSRETAVVFTSGGAIAVVASSLTGAGADQWQRLNAVTVNTGVTKIVVGARGTTLVSFNEHAHLEPDHITYR